MISEHPLDTLVPVENAAMAERTIIQWDKDDLDAVGLLKVDILALGMLSAIRRCFDLLRRHRGHDLCLATIPKEDPATYAMIEQGRHPRRVPDRVAGADVDVAQAQAADLLRPGD